MQISLYLKPRLLKQVDNRAKGSRKSRSRYIQEVLEKDIGGDGTKNVFDEVFGVLQLSDAEALLHGIRAGRKNSGRFP